MSTPTFTRVGATLETWCGPFKCYPCNPLGAASHSNSVAGTAPYMFGRRSWARLTGFRALTGRHPGFWRKVEGAGTFLLTDTEFEQAYDGEGNPVGDPELVTHTYGLTVGGACEFDDEDLKQGYVTADYTIDGAPGIFSPSGGSPPTHYEFQAAHTGWPSSPMSYFNTLAHSVMILYESSTALVAIDSITTNADDSSPYYSRSDGATGSASGSNGSTLTVADAAAAAWARAQARSPVAASSDTDAWRTLSGTATGLGLTWAAAWRLDALAVANQSAGSIGDTFGQIVRGKFGLPTNADLGEAIRLKFALKKYALPRWMADADRGNNGNSGMYAYRNFTRVQTTVVDPVNDLMLHPIDVLGSLQEGHSSWANAAWERVTVAHTGSGETLQWSLISATWEDRSLLMLCGDLANAGPNGWLGESRFRVRRVERDAANEVVSATEATFTTTFDPDQVAPFTGHIQGVPTTRGHTVTFTVVQWESRADAEAPWVARAGGLTYYRARRQGVWGFQGVAPAAGVPATYYRVIKFTAEVTEAFTIATPPTPADSEALGAAPTGYSIVAEFTATLTGPGVFTFAVDISGNIEGHPFEFIASIPGCSRRGGAISTSATTLGIGPSPLFPDGFDRIPYDLAFVPVVGPHYWPTFREAWVIPAPDPSLEVTDTQYKVTFNSNPPTPTWHPNRVVGGVETPELLDSTVEERICDKLPAEDPAAPGYMCEVEDVWVPADGELWLIPWFALMAPA